MKIECLLNTPQSNFESPFWHAEEKVLYWINLHDRSIHRYHPSSEQYDTWHVNYPISSIIPCNNNKLLLSLEKQLALFDLETHNFDVISKPICSAKGVNFNDAKCDAEGRVWIGTYDTQFSTSFGGGIYRLEHGHLQKMEDGMIVTNGITWSLDESIMYITDTLRRKIYKYLYHRKTGELEYDNVFITSNKEHGFPDGITTDSDSHIWVAQWLGGKLIRYKPSGKIDRIIELPTQHITSCCFGGDDMQTLYVTAANTSAKRRFLFGKKPPGVLYAIHFDDIKGMASNIYKV